MEGAHAATATSSARSSATAAAIATTAATTASTRARLLLRSSLLAILIELFFLGHVTFDLINRLLKLDSAIILIPLLLSLNCFKGLVEVFSAAGRLDTDCRELLDDAEVKLEILILLNHFLSTLAFLLLGSTILDHRRSFTFSF